MKAVVFDFDGTLYDKKGFVKHVILKNIFHLKLLTSERKTRRDFHGRFYPTKEEYYTAFFNALAKKSFRHVTTAEYWYKKQYLPSLTKILKKSYKIRPGFNRFFNYCKEHGIMVVLYSDYEIDKNRMLAIGADADAFSHLLCSPDFGGLKPCAESFVLALKEINLKPEDVLYVGDSDKCDRGVAEKTGCAYMDVNDFIESELFKKSQIEV